MTSCPVNLKGGASAHLQRVHMIFKYSGISYELVDMMKQVMTRIEKGTMKVMKFCTVHGQLFHNNLPMQLFVQISASKWRLLLQNFLKVYKRISSRSTSTNKTARKSKRTLHVRCFLFIVIVTLGHNFIIFGTFFQLLKTVRSSSSFPPRFCTDMTKPNSLQVGCIEVQLSTVQIVSHFLYLPRCPNN